MQVSSVYLALKFKYQNLSNSAITFIGQFGKEFCLSRGRNELNLMRDSMRLLPLQTYKCTLCVTIECFHRMTRFRLCLAHKASKQPFKATKHGATIQKKFKTNRVCQRVLSKRLQRGGVEKKKKSNSRMSNRDLGQKFKMQITERLQMKVTQRGSR